MELRISDIMQKYNLPYFCIKKLLDEYNFKEFFKIKIFSYNDNKIKIYVLPKEKITNFEAALKLYHYEIKQMKANR